MIEFWKKIVRIVFSRNAIIRLSIEHLSLIERFQWDSTINEMNLCRNHIRSLVNMTIFLRNEEYNRNNLE